MLTVLVKFVEPFGTFVKSSGPFYFRSSKSTKVFGVLKTFVDFFGRSAPDMERHRSLVDRMLIVNQSTRSYSVHISFWSKFGSFGAFFKI